MVKPAEDERLTILQSLLCGGIAGVLSRTLTSPLEVVKVLAQVGTPETRLGFVRSFGRIYQSEGLKAFWKGNGISCLRLVPYSAVQLAAFHKMLVSSTFFIITKNWIVQRWNFCDDGRVYFAGPAGRSAYPRKSQWYLLDGGRIRKCPYCSIFSVSSRHA